MINEPTNSTTFYEAEALPVTRQQCMCVRYRAISIELLDGLSFSKVKPRNMIPRCLSILHCFAGNTGPHYFSMSHRDLQNYAILMLSQN